MSSTPVTRKITLPKLYVSTGYTQKPPKKEEAYFQIFLKFSGDRILCQNYDFGRRGGNIDECQLTISKAVAAKRKVGTEWGQDHPVKEKGVTVFLRNPLILMVGQDRIELSTHGFSVLSISFYHVP